jgi:UDP-N-acetylmuramate dehydrogenase
VTKTDELIGLLDFLSATGQVFFVLGGGSNLLLPDEGFDGVVIKISTGQLRIDGEIIIAEAGVLLGSVVNTATQNSLSGLEWGAGIPGTVGGATRGNAGAMGQDMSKCVERVEIWQNGEIKELSNYECGFDYRGSSFKENGAVILRVFIKLKKDDQKKIIKQVKEYLDQRIGKFPSYPSAGCFFKNVKLNKWSNYPKDLPAIFIERGTVPVGWLVDQAGAKGLEFADAAVSDKHCNFVVNKKNASQADVLALVEEVKTRVYNKFKIELESEVEIVK